MTTIKFRELAEKVNEKWEPLDVAFINETALRVAKVDGAYKWHTHQEEDEFFLVLKGKVFIDLEGKSHELKENDGFLVKKGTRHRSRTEEPAWVLLIEPTRTKTKGEK